LKFYSAADKLLLTRKYNLITEQWETVNNNIDTKQPNTTQPTTKQPTTTQPDVKQTDKRQTQQPTTSDDWRDLVREMAALCPFQASDELEMTSVKLLSNGFEVVLTFKQVSKYKITNEELEEYKEAAKEFAKYIKKEGGFPNSVKMTVIGKDMAARELFRINY